MGGTCCCGLRPGKILVQGCWGVLSCVCVGCYSVHMTRKVTTTTDTLTDSMADHEPYPHTCTSQRSHSTSETRAIARRSAWQRTVRRAAGASSACEMSSSISHSRLLHMPDLAWGSLASGCEQAAFQSRRASPINEHGVGTFEHGRVEPPKLFAMSAARGQVCERRVMKLQNLGGRRLLAAALSMPSATVTTGAAQKTRERLPVA